MTDYRKAAGFSLLEILVAIMILGVGLVMVAAVFPVAADWTRQAAEQNLGQTIAQNALAIIRAKYAAGAGGGGQDLVSDGGLVGNAVGPLPGIEGIPLGQRAYQFGSNQPFPTDHPEACTYFWTALARKNPGSTPNAQLLDIYILIFHKGSADQTFTRTADSAWSGPTSEPAFVPEALAIPQDTVATAMRPGDFGIGGQSGTVFRRSVDASGNAVARPAISAADMQIWISPPADGTGASPLVYVYQTTLSY